MKIGYTLLAAGLVAIALAAPAHSASLLGGLINTGADSGNGSGIVSNNDNGSIGLGGSNGVSVNPGGALGGGGGLGGLLGGGNGSTGVPGVAEVSNNNGGTNASLLGGGGTNLNVPLGNLLGGGGNGLNVQLPNLGLNGVLGGPGAPGAPGAPGTNGVGFNGLGGSNGFNGFNGFNGSNGGAGVSLPANISSRLRSILAVLAARDWIRLANGQAICLSSFGTAEVSSILPQKDWSGLNQALPGYAQDIATLRQLLANCRSSSQRAALNVRDLNRVIGIDINRSGQPVLYML